MFHISPSSHGSKAESYRELSTILASILSGERDFIANLANTSALLNQNLSDLNWVGFYLLKEGELVLGPFQGKVACIRIALGRGVCGTVAANKQTLIVPDVEDFPGHIACDSASRSEIVIPLLKEGRLLGVLDLDSPLLDRFDSEDAAGLESMVKILLDASSLPS